MRLLTVAAAGLMACHSTVPIRDGSEFWATKLGAAFPAHVRVRQVPGLADGWRCGDAPAKGAVHGVAFEELRYCGLDNALGSVSVHLEGALASESALARFCDGIGAGEEEFEALDTRTVACGVEGPNGEISGTYAEVGALRVLLLTRRDRGVMKEFYARARAEIVRRARDKEL